MLVVTTNRPPRSPSRRAILMADSEASKDELPPTQRCMNPECDAVWHCPLEPPPMAELCGECYTTHELCYTCGQESDLSSKEETPATPSGPAHLPILPGSARTPLKDASTSYLRKLLADHAAVRALCTGVCSRVRTLVRRTPSMAHIAAAAGTGGWCLTGG